MRNRLFNTLGIVAILGMLAAPLAAAPVNLAPGGTANASSSDFGSVAADGNDANRNGTFGAGSVWHSNTTGASFYEIDLGADTYLDRVQVFPRTDTIQGSVENFRITVVDSNTDTVFSKDYFATGSTSDLTWATNDLRHVSGQKVRITRLDGSPNFMTFAEFEVYGQSTQIGANIAAGKSVTSSATGFGTVAADVNDGVIDGHYSHTDAQNGSATVGSGGPTYHSANSGIGQFVQIDLGYNARIDYVNLFDRVDSLTTGTVKVSILDDTLTEVDSTTINLNATDLGANRYDAVFDPVGSTVGRYVKVETTGTTFLQLAEVEAIAAVNAPMSTLDLADIVGGGDGTGTGSDAGVKLADGTLTSAHRASGSGGVAVNTNVAAAHSFIDSVFIPDGNTGGGAGTAVIPVSTTGVTTTGISDSDNGNSWDEIWNGHNTGVSSALTGNYSSIMGVHSSKGITFDLQAINAANPGLYAALFTADAVVAAFGTVDFYVLIDGDIVSFDSVTGTDNLASISVDIGVHDKFLTLIASASGTDGGDWSYFGDPTLTLKTIPTPAALPAGLIMLIAVGARRRRRTA